MPMGNSCRVLFIAKSFPPQGGSPVQRTAKFVKYLPDFGVEPLVLTVDGHVPLRDGRLEGEIPPSVKVSRVFSPEPGHLKIRVAERFNGSATVGMPLKSLLKLYSMLYYRACLVDWSIGWVPFAIRRGLELIRRNRIDVIYAHTPPPTPFLVGYHLKRKTGLPLVIDYADPWTTEPFFDDRGNDLDIRFCRTREDRCLRLADRVVYCKGTIFEAVTKRYPGAEPRKFTLIPNGYDPADFPEAAPAGSRRPCRIVYTGKLTDRYFYCPRSFFSALGGLLDERVILPGDVEVVMAGLASGEHLGLIDRFGLRGVVRHLGYVDHRKSIECLQSADVLLLIIESPEGAEKSASYAGFMPAKIFEYLYTGKPILGIVPEGPEAEMLRKSRLGVLARPNDAASVKRALAALLGNRGERNKPDPDWDFIRTFDRRRLAGRLASVFHELSGGPAAGRPMAPAEAPLRT